MSNFTRRRLFTRSAAAAGTALLFSSGRARGLQRAVGHPLGANDRIRLAVAGINGKGGHHIQVYSDMAKNNNVELVYLVDPDARLFASRTKIVEERGGYRPKFCIQDVRYALDDQSLDAVSIATPNHWHSLMTIWACQAGKDVYVEKPMSHNIREGRLAVETARKYNRIVQHGTHSRSFLDIARFIAVVRSGRLGKLLVSRGLCYKDGGSGRATRGDIGYAPHKAPPPELNFDLWLGPGPRQAYHDNLVHYRWHWFWDFGNGDLGNQGVHEMDIARWAIPNATLPDSVISFGGRLGHQDQGEAASTQMAVMHFGETPLVFETRGLPSDDYRGVKVGNVFELEGGTIIHGSKAGQAVFYPKGGKEPAPLPEVPFTLGPGEGAAVAFSNFIAAMRSRKVSDLNADVLEGHYSSALCHLANISLRLGGKVPFRPRTEDFPDHPAALDALERMEQYLAKNGTNPDKDGYTLGRKLTIDKMTETFADDRQANDLLTRHYRKPFAVPEPV